jgi:cyclopropane fatty-acyl-phospholipid synthase-like methyltransferase
MLAATSDPTAFYKLFKRQGAFGLEPDQPLTNMGYWRMANPGQRRGLAVANQALFDLACRGAEVSPADDWVLDVGCGYGRHASYCLENYGPRHVIGLNLLIPEQLSSGQRVISRASLAERITLLAASATLLPLPAGLVDKVISIEAAFHFDSRQTFFQEAYRVLRPGGILSLLDLVALPPRTSAETAVLAYLCAGLQMPKKNVYDAQTYRTELEAAGFTILEQESLYQDVFPPFQKWFMTQYFSVRQSFRFWHGLASLGYFIYPWDYLRIKARKVAGE